MKMFRIIIFPLWFLALSVLILPDIFQLALHSHEHTEDKIITCCDLHFEEAHHHCLELDFYVLSIYYTTTHSLAFTYDQVPITDKVIEELSWVDLQPVFLRGPPASTC